MDSSSSAISGRSPVQKDLQKTSSETAPANDLLQQGLTNLADQNLDAAIALLAAVLDENPPTAIAHRARVGLVKAYQRRGDLDNAIACCRPLLNASHDPTRRWGHRALAALHNLAFRTDAAAQKPSPLPSVPKEDGVSSSGASVSMAGADITGFVPLIPEENAPAAVAKPVSEPASKPTLNQSSSTPQTTDPPDEPPSPEVLPQKRAPMGRPTTSVLPWRQAGRAQRWAPLPAVSKAEQAIVSLWTVASLVGLVSSLLQLMMALGNPVRRFAERFMFVNRWRLLEEHPTAIVIFGVLLLWLLSPWMLQAILKRQGAKPLALERFSQISPVAGRLLRDYPHTLRLRILPIRAPLLFSYGLHPRLSWLVVSDGLRQMQEDDVAVLVAAELSHLQSLSTACLSLAVAASQIPHVLYRSIAAWGDRQSVGLLRGLAAAASALCYGLFWLFRWPTVWLSRWRLWQSDRLAVSRTGHPNGLARALIDLSAAMTTERRRDPSLSVLLDGFAPLLPVSPEAALPFEWLARHPMPGPEFYGELRRRLQWPCPTQHRRCLTLNRTHPPLDERLRSLMATAVQWRLDPEIPQFDRLGAATSRSDMLLQTAPYWGPIAGAGLALILWSIGGVAGRQTVLGWLWGDRAVLHGLTAIGASMGLLARINRYFPDSPTPLTPEQVNLPALQGTVGAPVQAIPVKLRGKLLGRRGLLNALGQDLLLDTEDGLVRVSFTSTLGPIGNLILGSPPYRLIGRTVTVTGWLRRGATAWVDANRISATGKPVCIANHPAWSTLVAFGLALWGAWTIYWGS
ncbi:MAG: tetratricopeptide repeat protein [Elainellaceae cyanobacterium]